MDHPLDLDYVRLRKSILVTSSLKRLQCRLEADIDIFL